TPARDLPANVRLFSRRSGQVRSIRPSKGPQQNYVHSGLSDRSARIRSGKDRQGKGRGPGCNESNGESCSRHDSR
ncbi:hypothetical protein KI387_016160, partial [Taxus chinensis]